MSKQIIFNQEYYDQLRSSLQDDQFGFEEISMGLGTLSNELLRNLWLYHVKADIFQDKVQQGKKVIATTGFGLTGVPHVGTIAQIIRAIRLQQSGIPVQIVLGDLDAYNGKGLPIKTVRSWVEKFKAYIKSLGFVEDHRSVIRTQYDDLETLRIMYLTGNYITDEMFDAAKEDVHEYYYQQGKLEESMSYPMKLSLNLMVADFLGLHVLHGYDAVLVFLGIDEYKYVKLAMEVLESIKNEKDGRFSDFILAGIYSRVIKGFNGHPKMGKSLEGSGVDVNMSLDEVRSLLMDGEGEYTTPEDSVVFQMLTSVSHYDVSKIMHGRELCIKGGQDWKDFKNEYAFHLYQILSKW